MSERISSIAVVGTGAVGGYYGGRLAQHGHDVHFLLRSDYQAILKNGLEVRSHHGDFTLPPGSVHVYDDPRKMPRVDLVLVTLKTTSNHQYEPLIAPLLHERTVILTLQNGLGNEDRLAELFGAERIMGGMAFVCINRIGPGVIHHMDHGVIRMGEFVGGPSPRARQVADMFNASRVECEVLPDLRWGRWAKLVWNVPFNGLGAVTDLTTDRLMNTKPGVQFLTALMREVIATAEAEGKTMPADMIERQMTHTSTMLAYRSSMQVDRQEGRALEVEAILGEPLRAAERLGVPTPHLKHVYELARVVDPGALPAERREG